MSVTSGGQSPEWSDGWLLPVLVQAGLLSEPDVPRLRQTGAASAWQACVQAGVASDERILAAVAERFRVRIADVDALPAEAASLMPAELALRLKVVPLALESQALDVACARPTDLDLERTLSFGVGRRVRLQLASPAAIERALARLYPCGPAEGGARADTRSAERRAEGLARELEDVIAAAGSADPPIAELVDALIVRGVRMGATDLHLEPSAQALVARYRVDGALREVARIPRTAAVLLLNRLKVMASLEVADRMRPQEGRARVTANGRKVDLRISSLPVAGLGEKILVRILDWGATVTRLEELGLSEAELSALTELLRGREGLVLVTGPAASGKTTTLYAALRAVRSTELNIVTVEDPIEYRVEGVSQVQVNERSGLNYATTLRSVVRQDPDVIMVGELRDRETAEVAVQAALTGHLVLSALHTGDVVSTVMRLVDMGVDPSALSSALRGVVAQRLVRRVCPTCAAPLTLAQLPAAQQALLADIQVEALRRASGCPECGGTGYRGRLALAEFATFDATAQRAIARGAPAEELVAACRRAGMRSLWESGLSRVACGITTLHELLDNVAAPAAPVAPVVPVAPVAPIAPAAAPADAAERSLSQDDIDALVTRMLREREAAAAAAPAPSPPGESAAVPQSSVVPDAPSPAGTSPRPRVLLVDDDGEARRQLREGLLAEGLRVLEAADGETALEYIKRIRPDIIVLELALPRVDGFGILRMLAEDPVPPVPCVVVTVQDDPDVATWVSELGASDYLVKPVSARVLAERLRTRLGVS